MMHLHQAELVYFDHWFELEDKPGCYEEMTVETRRAVRDWLLEAFCLGIDLVRKWEQR